jgi:orotidine-5'-phosphate decarboxylase
VLKVGLEAYTLWGPRAVEQAREHSGRIFLDLKLHDIPRTVGRAAAAAADQEASYLTAHAAGGPEMMAAAVDGAGETAVLAITLLTHLDRDGLRRLGIESTPEGVVLQRAALASEAGCAGVVCAPPELPRLRGQFEAPFLLVTPGIRFDRPGPDDDQRRTSGPASALAGGADLLVIGRPLTAAEDPEAALERLERLIVA